MRCGFITTGIEANDLVSVQAHTNPDTFAFALGTGVGGNFTTVSGAAVGDHVVVNGGQLGGTLIQASTPTSATDLATFITSLGPLTKGDTYAGFNQSANETFIVTDTHDGQIGGVEITGHAFAHNSIAGHVLTPP